MAEKPDTLSTEDPLGGIGSLVLSDSTPYP